jgi:hypothetical protein
MPTFQLQPTLLKGSLEVFSEDFEKEYLSDARHTATAQIGVWCPPTIPKPGDKNRSSVQTGESDAYDQDDRIFACSGPGVKHCHDAGIRLPTRICPLRRRLLSHSLMKSFAVGGVP